MTCVVGYVKGSDMWMGADSAGVDGWDLRVRKDAKVFVRRSKAIRGPMLIGFTTSFRMGQLLRYSLKVPAQRKGCAVERYMMTAFIDAVRACFKKGGMAYVEHTRETGGEFLVAYAGRLFTVHGNYQVGELAVPYAAVGCGESYAMGSLHSSAIRGVTYPATAIENALRAAEAFSAGVRRPFEVLHVTLGVKGNKSE